MKKPWWLRLPERLSRLAFAFVLMWDNAVIKKCQYCGSWKIRIVSSNQSGDNYEDKCVCDNCGAEGYLLELWETKEKAQEREIRKNA